MSKYEPDHHKLIKQSFVSVPTAGMRSAPEVLILELMREVFFRPRYGGPGEKLLRPQESSGPSNSEYTSGQCAVIYALRGRRKVRAQSNFDSYYAPAYPSLAKRAWLRPKSDRVVRDFLFAGPIAQHIFGNGKSAEEMNICKTTKKALLGNRDFDEDILFMALEQKPGSDDGDTDNIQDMINAGRKNNRVMHFGKVDKLSERITNDFMAICDLEKTVPRLQWIQLLMTFLRFALPMWLLAQMQITRFIHKWLIDAMDNSMIPIPGEREIIDALLNRNQSLMSPALIPTREIHDRIERYMKCRIEINVLLGHLEQVAPWLGKSTALSVVKSDTNAVSIEELLLEARDKAEELKESPEFHRQRSLRVQDFLTRKCEQYAAWRKPVKVGQGKNIDEFFRVLYKPVGGDSAGGHLLDSRRAPQGFLVFPGQMLINLAVLLAAKDKSRDNQEAGRLILGDVEKLFGQYGIDFSMATEARERLMEELKALGLLAGSPDAGSSAPVACSFA